MLVDKSGNPTVSVIIPSYGAADTISYTLDALVNQETDLRYEVIVVESSNDGSREIIQRYPGVQLAIPEGRLYSGASRNFGVEKSSGRYILLLDSDCIPEPTWIQRMTDTLESGICTGIGGAILNGNPESRVSVAGYISEFSHLYPIGKRRRIDYLPGGNSAFSADTYKKYGGFDSREPLYVDLMFGKKLTAAGEILLFDPSITVKHAHRSTANEHLPHQIGRGRAAAIARRRKLLVGESWVKYPVLAVFVVPGLFLRKSIVFTVRFARAFPLEIGSLIKALPPFWLGMIYWHYGFMKEVLKPTESRLSREISTECTNN
ncbi:MAG: glycosyltransferase family 2 protein [Armatimonadota bacterium]